MFHFLRWLTALCVCVFMFAAGDAFAQQPGAGPFGRGAGQPPFPGGGRGGRLGMPPRDNAEPQTGTGRIAGRVVSAETGTPVRRAQVSLNAREARVNRNVATDNEGRFEFAGLPAGRYRLNVNKAGYVPLEYGQARPFESGKPLDLADSGVLDKIDFSLPRGSVITGRIIDEYGDPITDVQVQALRYQFVNGERQLVNAGRAARTDDLGQYRIFGLMPGDYVVHATLRDGPQRAREQSTGHVGYPGTYYPGVAEVGQAQPVTVTLAQELSGIAFSLVPARFARVSGTVVASDGRPLDGAMLLLRPRMGGGGPLMNLLGGAGRSQTDSNGSFRMMSVPPGDYILEVQQRPNRQQNVQQALTQLEFASVPVNVAGDIDNFMVVTTAGTSMSGRVVYEGAQNPPRAGMQVMAVGGDGTPSLRGIAGRALGVGRVSGDNTFQLQGLYGPQMIRVQGVPAGWALKSITVNGLDVTDTPFDFKSAGTITGAIVTLTNRLSEITGQVRDARGQPMADYVLVVFPDDPKLWAAPSRHVQSTRPNQNGTFSVKGLPAGRYLAAAIPSLENGLQNDPTVLAGLRGIAEPFAIGDGEAVNLNLTMRSP